MSNCDIGKNELIREAETTINVICLNCGKEIKAIEKYNEKECELEIYPCTDLECFMSTKFAKENRQKIYVELKKEFKDEI